jgi:hypothetical protein
MAWVLCSGFTTDPDLCWNKSNYQFKNHCVLSCKKEVLIDVPSNDE